MVTKNTKKSSECVHHYMLPEPDGVNEVVGVCKKCGHEKEHELTIPWKVWNSWRGDPKKRKQTEAMSAGAAEENRKVKRREYRQKGTNDK